MTTFSRGMRQKVLISAALLHNPSVLFLDEPLSGLDANTALVLKELLRELASQGKTVFYCSHVLEVVEKVCDRIVILNSGRDHRRRERRGTQGHDAERRLSRASSAS